MNSSTLDTNYNNSARSSAGSTGAYIRDSYLARVLSVNAFGIIEYQLEGFGQTSTCPPLDRSVTKYPIPGEMVTLEIFDKLTYYTHVIGNPSNTTYNPTRNQTASSLSISDPGKVLQSDNKIKVYKQLIPYEGDFILQGRFGTSIRFGCTQQKTIGQYSKKADGFTWADPKGPGISGDGIMILRADRDYITDDGGNEDKYTQEDINNDDSSIYIATSQKVPINVATTADILKTWSYTLSEPDEVSEAAADTRTAIALANEVVFDLEPFNEDGNVDPEKVLPNLEAIDDSHTPGLWDAMQPSLAAVQEDTSLKKGTKKAQVKKTILGIDDNKNNYTAGSQIIINSDRILLNSREDYLLLFGQEGVAISSPGSVNIDAKDDIHIYSDSNLYLGLPGRGIDLSKGGGITKAPNSKAEPTIDEDYEPLVLGQKLADLLEDLIETIANAVMISPTGDSAFKEAERATFNQIKARIPEMLSTYAFIDGISHGGPDADPGGPSNLSNEIPIIPNNTNNPINPISPTGTTTLNTNTGEPNSNEPNNSQSDWFDEDSSEIDPNINPNII